MDRQQWLNWRRTKIGASDAPIIMKCSPYKTPYQLWNEKKYGTIQEENSAMKRGSDLESAALSSFEKKMNVFLKHQDIAQHPKIPYMAATLDGFDGKTLVEIKCPGKEDHAVARENRTPKKYYPQLQHQLEVTGLDGMYYYSFDGTDGVIVEVQRDQKYIDRLLEEERIFWDLLQGESAPVLTERDFIKRDEEWETLARKRYEVMQKIKELKREDEELQEKLIALSGDHSSVGGGFKFTRSVLEGRIDFSEIPELVGVDLEKYRKNPCVRWTLTAI